MPVADLKDEILRLAAQPVGPEPLTPAPERPKLGEPTDTDALKTEILRIAAAGEPRGAFRRYAGALGQTVAGAYGRGMEGIGLLAGGAQPSVADQAFDGAVPGEPGIANAAVEAGQALQPTLTRPGEEGVIQNLGTVTGSIATFAPAAALGGIPGFLAVTGAGTAQAAPDAFYTAKANGASDADAWKVAIVSSLTQGALEQLGPERLIGKIASAMAKADRATGGAGKELLWSALGEGGEEIAQHWADVAAQQLYDGTPDVNWAKELRSSLEQGAYGVAGGGAMGALALAAERVARQEGLPGIEDAPTPYADKPDRTPPVYDPIERDLTPEEESALEKWKADRGATRVDVVERPDMTEATELARKAGLDVLFVDDDGKGAKEGVTFNRSTAIVPANADPATVGLAIATHEGVHGMPKSAREALRSALAGAEATKGPLEQAGKDYADRAEKEGVKLSKADLEEEATADLVAALAPVAQRVMRNPARAVALMNDKPGVMVKVLDFARKWAGKTTHAEMVAKEIESLGEVQSALAKGMTGRQRVQAAGKIVEAFSKIDVAMKQPIRPRLKASAEPIGPAAAPEPTAVEARGEDVPVDPGLGALRAKDEPAPAPVVSAKTKTLQESLDERAVSARGRATEKEARAQAIESRPRVTKAARRRAARLRNQAKMLNEGAASMETQSKALAWKNRDPNEQKSPGDRVRFEDGREGTVASSHEDGSLRVRVQRPPGKGESAEDAARVMYDYVTVRAPDVLRVEAARPVEQQQAKAAPATKDAPAPVRAEKPIALTASKEAIANEFDKLSKKQTHYMGHKGDFFKKAANWLAGNLDLRGVKTIYDMYAGGGTYGLTYALSGVAPDVQRVVVNEVDAIRRHKFDIARRHGGDIMDPWDTSPFLIELRNTIDALVAGNGSTSPASLAIDTITGDESAKGAYEQYLPMRSRYQALSMDEKAALLALRDVMFSGRTATVAKLFENARQDADNVRLLVKRAAARGIKVEVVSMDALGPEAIKMVQGGGRSFVVLDPPYHGTASGNYSAGGKKYDFKSDEFLQMNLAAAKEMSRGNAVLYNNAATDGVRAGALAAFGSQMQTFEWLRQKRGDAPAQQEFLGVIDNGQGKSSGSRGNVGVGSASAASGKAGGNGGVLATARGDGRGQAGTGATGDARGAGGGDARYSLASDAGAQGEDVEAARKAWKEQGTESPWFKRWFGDSVVKKGGKPLVMYHGTDQDFAAFDKRLGGSATLARDAQGVMFFTSSPHVAEDFAGYVYRKTEDGKDVERRYGNGANIMPVYLKAENPLVWEMGGGSYTDSFLADAIKEAKSEGYDSVIFADMRDGSVSTVGPWKKSNIVAVFEPTQIKSATGNRGTFSPANPDIRYSLRDIDPADEIRRQVKANIEAAKQGEEVVADPLASPDPRVTVRRAEVAIQGALPRETRTQAAVEREAKAILGDPERLLDVRTRAENLVPLSDAETVALGYFARDKIASGFGTGRADDIDAAISEYWNYTAQRTAQSSALRSASDVFKSDKDRMLSLMMTPTRKVQRALKRAKGDARTKILREEAARVQRIRYSLAQRGIDPGLIPENYYSDPSFQHTVADVNAEVRGQGLLLKDDDGNAQFPYISKDYTIAMRRGNMLSGSLTLIKNVFGTSSHIAYDRMLKLALDAIVPGTDTTMGDVRAYVSSIITGHARGWAEFTTSYRDFYLRSSENTSMDDYPVLDRGPILKANEAIGVRLQSAADSYMRAVVLEAEKELRARQMAREHGGTADDYRENEDVLGQADFDTKRALFHDRDNITRAVTMWRDAADQVPYVPPLGSFLVPFAATPTKIAQRGVEMALGPFGGIVSDLGTPDNVREKVDTDPEKWGRRLLGAGAWAFAMFLAALHDDEDGLPFITGTQDMYGKGDFQDRTAPAQSIRTPWGTYVSYRYAEPGSTGMATLIDTFRADKPAAEWMASTMTAIKDKSFFQSLERISKAAMDYANGKEAGISRLARETLWSPMFPNALKQPVRAADENRRLEFGNFLEPRDLAYAALPLETWAPPLKYDRWGREVTKGGAAWSASYLGWLTNWLSPVPVTRDIAEIEPIDIKLAHYYETNKKPGMRDAPDRGDMTEEEYADFTRLAGGRSLEILRPWVAQKATLTERDVEHIHDVENRVRKQVRAQIERNRR